MAERKTSVAYKKRVKDKAGEWKVVDCMPAIKAKEEVPVIDAEELDSYALDFEKKRRDIIKIDSKMSLETQRRLAAEKYKMNTADLVCILSDIAHDKDQITSDRIKAVGQASKIMGLDAPILIEQSYKGIMIELTKISSEEINEFLKLGRNNE